MSAARDDGANREAGFTKTRRPYGVACTTCRRAKMKCVQSGLETERCDRCVRLGRDCVYEPHRRGLWRREQMDGRLRDHNQASGDNTYPPPGQLSETRDSTAPPAMPLPGQVPRGGNGNVFMGEHAIMSRSQALPLEPPRTQSEMKTASFVAQSLITLSEDTRGLSLNTALDPEKRILNGATNNDKSLATRPTEGTSWGSDDPINLRLISRPSAEYLFEGFFKHFNPLVGLLDPQLYTFSYTRETSSLLLSTILAISARVFQPESYNSIQKHSGTLLAQALLACDATVENIWAIVCVYHWKDVNDTRGYTLLGFATRMAASAKWNKFQGSMVLENTPLVIAQTEAQIRQQRDKERVWLALGNLDRASSLFTDRPVALQMINNEIGARSWLSLEKWTFPLGDGKAVAVFELTQITCPVLDAMAKSRQKAGPSSTPVSLESFSKHLETLNVALMEWAQHWCSKFREFPGPELFQMPILYFLRDYTQLYFNSVLLDRILVTNESNNISSDSGVAGTIQLCFSCALGVLRQLTEMGKLDILYFLWDTAHLMTAYSAMMVLKLSSQPGHLTPGSTHEAFGVLAEVSRLYSTAASSLHMADSHTSQSLDGTALPGSPVGIQARLLGAILARLESKSQIAGDAKSGESTSNTLDPGIPSIQNRYQPDISYTTAEGEGTTHNLFPTSTAESFHNTDVTSTQDVDFMMDSDFINSSFTLAGLLSWDEPGIFIEPH
ncbi:hypothetical protein B0J13DRAFT_69948 [Dactylonectria estremocensis]|uniref:Zn(2)-C6 fungal-type domain-containing protein n=1 Tax=Dactylonectria estremocensis TaxID=1079267 RepID=A0A9P9IZV7_9HYPO|nr:hypothetical protein B0J13DRAFT_69948 [Dactylonectria estremocensis]